MNIHGADRHQPSENWWLSGDGCPHPPTGHHPKPLLPLKLKGSSHWFLLPWGPPPPEHRPAAAEGLSAAPSSDSRASTAPAQLRPKPCPVGCRVVCIKARFKEPVPLQRKGIDKYINHVFLLIRLFTQKCSSENLYSLLWRQQSQGAAPRGAARRAALGPRAPVTSTATERAAFNSGPTCDTRKMAHVLL